MANVLPQQAGLTVGGVAYRYTAVKDVQADMLVNVQNENALGTGFIFRETDNWSGIPGNTITKLVPVDNIPLEFWGNGSIDVQGEGEVQNPSVIYTYQFEPCFDPQSSPACPGYKDPLDMLLEAVEVRDPLDDSFIQDELDRKATLRDEDQEDRDRKRVSSSKKEKEIDIEKLMSVVNTALMTANAAAKEAELLAMNYIPTTYYAAIPGGVYEDNRKLPDNNLPNNKQGLRVGLAQQLLHEKMVSLQYEK
jgi:hypothetical protein